MSTALTADVESVKDAALSLPVSARAYLAEALLESLDHSDDELAELAVPAQAVALAEERLRAIRAGHAQTIPLGDAMTRLSAGQPA